MVSEAVGTGGGAGPAAGRGAAPLRDAGGLYASAQRGDPPVPGGPGGGAGGGRRHLQADPHGGRHYRRLRGPDGGTGIAGIPADRTGGAGTVRAERLPGRIPGLSADLRPGRGGDRSRPGEPGHRGDPVRPGGGHRDPGGGQPPGFYHLRPRYTGTYGAAALSGAAAVHAVQSGGGEPLRCVAAARDAVFDGYPDEDLSHRRRQLGAVRRRALCRHLQGQRKRTGGGAEPAAGRGVVPGHAGRQERQCPGLCGGGGCGYPGHRGRCSHSGQPGAGAADPGAGSGQNRDPALYAGLELELHGAHELPAGGHAHHGGHRHPADRHPGGRADLPAVAADARI